VAFAYSTKVIAESSNPSNMGRMPDPDAYGIIHGCCGDTIVEERVEFRFARLARRIK
jgi:NifU-like protein involved in Fe-S cluster formation